MQAMPDKSVMRSPETSLLPSPSRAPVNRIAGFGRLLRINGILVSQAEIADALQAFEAMPAALQSRDSFSAILAATLVKRSTDLPIFQKLFALWFEIARSPATPNHHDHHHSAPPEIAGIDLLPR